jgi:hypothetical protein
MDDLNTNRYLPFPETDFDKNGNLKKVRSRMLRKLLKYEFKNTFKAVGLAAIIYAAVAAFICAFGFLSFHTVDSQTVSNISKVSGFTFWVLGIVVLIYGALFLFIFPIISSFIRYGKSFFRSQGYLTHSIPATPEEQLLSKRICAFVYSFACAVIASAGIAFAILPAITFESFDLSTILSDIEFPQAINDWIYLTLAFPIGVWTAHSVCGFVRCWFHRGLKVWVFILILVGGYFATLYGTVTLTLVFEAEEFYLSPLASRIINWILLAGSCVLSYFIFRYEAYTLRKKINLK